MTASLGDIKLIIFDNDGTLMNTEPVYNIAHKEIAGSIMDPEFKTTLKGRTPIEASKMCCEHYHLNMAPEEYLRRREEIIFKIWPTVDLLPGVAKVVTEFSKREIPMAIATASGREEFWLKATKHHDITDKIAHIVCADDVKRGKPAPDLFLAALAKFEGIKPENALVFEDSPLGILAANAAGMPAVFVPENNPNPEQTLRDNNAHAVMIINSFEEFDFSRFNFIK